MGINNVKKLTRSYTLYCGKDGGMHWSPAYAVLRQAGRNGYVRWPGDCRQPVSRQAGLPAAQIKHSIHTHTCVAGHRVI
ncbi:MAG: hypothetical protein ACOYW3_00330 [Bacteroidota bacterium]